MIGIKSERECSHVVFALEVSVLLFSDSSLSFIQGLLYELSILNVQNTVSITFDLRVMSYHHAGSGSLFSFTLRSNSVDIEDEIHDGNSRARVKITSRFIEK